MKNNKVASFLLVLMLLMVVFGIAYVCFGSISKGAATLPRMDSLTVTYTADGDCIKAYVLRDPDTGVEYLVTDHGGITPRL